MSLIAKPNRDNVKNVVYCLTRGYPLTRKLNYVLLVLRNISVIVYLLRTHQLKTTRILIMHEGNVSKTDQIFLNLFAFGRLHFRSVSEDFKALPIHIWKASDRNLGYALMCRFQYAKVWKYLKEYEKALRVDEDIIFINGPLLSSMKILRTGLLISESHSDTNESLPAELKARGLGGFYDHEFPYTNVMGLSLDFWLADHVRSQLESVGDSAFALTKRWGDLPMFGVMAKKLGKITSNEMLEKKFTYLHLSHLTLVRRGRLQNLALFQGLVNLSSRLKAILRMPRQ